MGNCGPEEPEATEHPKGKGLFLVRGGQLTIPKGALSLRVSEDGSLESELKEILLSNEMVTPWVSIGMDHLRAATAANAVVLAADAEDADDRLAAGLQDEMASSMQAIVAAASALEAFYAGVRDRLELPADLVKKWQDRRSRRATQVAEVLRRAVRLPNRGAKNLKSMVKDLYKFRGWAVHPPSAAQRPAFRADISRGVEWRFQAFQLSHASLLTRSALAIIVQVSQRSEKAAGEPLKDFLDATAESLVPSCERWEQSFGPLLDDS